MLSGWKCSAGWGTAVITVSKASRKERKQLIFAAAKVEELKPEKMDNLGSVMWRKPQARLISLITAASDTVPSLHLWYGSEARWLRTWRHVTKAKMANPATSQMLIRFIS